MYRRICILFTVLSISLTFLYSIPVSFQTASLIANNVINSQSRNANLNLLNSSTISENNHVLAFVFDYSPTGYLVISADDSLEPIIAYSTNSNFNYEDQSQPFSQIIKEDLKLRLQAINKLPKTILEKRANKWHNLKSKAYDRTPVQWPPEGSTPYGGWLTCRWSQDAPYNNFCPMDLATNSRSVAGCPSIAMGQIVSYNSALNGTQFTTTDAYHHNYGSNNFWIDQDSTTYSFPGFYTLNNYLKECSHHFRYNENLTNQDKAAITFACGIAAHQVYSSQGSGTFGVSQAFEAYQRFNFQNMELLTQNSPDLFPRIIQNMMEAKPVHFAIVTPANDAGHNVVIDGYNTDGYYHVNFGWGGSQDGWYMLPNEMPYSLTVVEGAIVDICPYEYTEVNPQQIEMLDENNIQNQYTIRVSNSVLNSNVTIESYMLLNPTNLVSWDISPALDSLGINLAFGQHFDFTLIPHLTTTALRDTIESKFRIIFDNGFKDVIIRINPDAVVQDNFEIKPLNTLYQNYPNPFNPETVINYNLAKPAFVSLNIYNSKGQLVKNIVNQAQASGIHNITWNGKNSENQTCANGVYFYRLKTNDSVLTNKMLLLK